MYVFVCDGVCCLYVCMYVCTLACIRVICMTLLVCGITYPVLHIPVVAEILHYARPKQLNE